MDTRSILQSVDDVVAPVLANMGYELVERELMMGAGRWILRLYIDREGGVTIDDCEKASRGIEDMIEIEGLVSQSYSLEVSSPGIDRPLRRRKDFDRFSGVIIKLKTLSPIDGRSNYKGILKGMDGEDIVMEVDGQCCRIPYNLLAKARVEGDRR